MKENGYCWYYVTDRQYHDYELEQIKEWKDLKSNDKNKIGKPKQKEADSRMEWFRKAQWMLVSKDDWKKEQKYDCNA